MSRRILLAPLLALVIVGCGGGGDAADEADLPGDSASRGAALVSSNGCLGCHRLGKTGNSGPGPDLTQVGGRLSREEIDEVLVDPQPPMPSFANMPDDDRAAIAEYLSALK